MNFKRLAMNLIVPLGKDLDVNQPMERADHHLLDLGAIPLCMVDQLPPNSLASRVKRAR